MAQEKTPENRGFTTSKYVKMLMVILMAFLLFGGPYIVYLINDALEMSFLYADIAGAVSVVLGLVLMWYLIRAKIIT
jgi:ABC-type Mn2+/Zn2+ transport system permease subunit